MRKSTSRNQRTFPAGCKIVNIRRGKGHREVYVYADLIGPDGQLLIAATLDYITDQLMYANIANS